MKITKKLDYLYTKKNFFKLIIFVLFKFKKRTINFYSIRL